MCTRVHVFMSNLCRNLKNGICAAAHVTILVLQGHLLNLKMFKDQDVIVKCGVLIFVFAIYIVHNKMNW